jgi:hypothetical protein
MNNTKLLNQDQQLALGHFAYHVMRLQGKKKTKARDKQLAAAVNNAYDTLEILGLSLDQTKDLLHEVTSYIFSKQGSQDLNPIFTQAGYKL